MQIHLLLLKTLLLHRESDFSDRPLVISWLRCPVQIGPPLHSLPYLCFPFPTTQWVDPIASLSPYVLSGRQRGQKEGEEEKGNKTVHTPAALVTQFTERKRERVNHWIIHWIGYWICPELFFCSFSSFKGNNSPQLRIHTWLATCLPRSLFWWLFLCSIQWSSSLTSLFLDLISTTTTRANKKETQVNNRDNS